MDDKDINNIVEGMKRHVDNTAPRSVSISQGVTEDEAICQVQKQFTDAGYGCPEETARKLVRQAWDRAAS